MLLPMGSATSVAAIVVATIPTITKAWVNTLRAIESSVIGWGRAAKNALGLSRGERRREESIERIRE